VSAEVRLLRFPEVSRRVGLKRSAIYARIAKNEFPAPIALGPRTAAWPSDAIDAWIAARIQANQKPARPGRIEARV